MKPDFAEAHTNFGSLLQELGRLEEAEESYKKAIDLNNGLVKAKVGLGNVMMLKGQHKEGLDQIRQYNGAIFFDIDNWVVIQ